MSFWMESSRAAIRESVMNASAMLAEHVSDEVLEGVRAGMEVAFESCLAVSDPVFKTTPGELHEALKEMKEDVLGSFPKEAER